MNKLFQLMFEIQGFPIKKAIKEFNSINELSIQEKHHNQIKKSWSIYKYHLQNNDLYREFINSKVIHDWSQIPILSKKDIQAPLEKRLSKPYSKKNIFVNNTSGSSGTPFYYAKDKFCHAMVWATINDRFSRHGVSLGSSLQARFYGIPANGPKYYKELLKDFFAKRIRIPVFDLSEGKLLEIRRLFEAKKFHNVNGYTSSLVLFAKYLISEGISAKEICPSLQVVFPTSEVCDDIDREILEKGFGVKVVNEYGASELDLIAFQDEDGDWILNNETLFVEIVDKEGKEVPPGVEGRVVVTSLYNKAMPFIRYDLGDLAIKSERKKGSYTILKKVTGRTNDFAILPSGKKAAGLTFYYITKSLLEKGSNMSEFIIKQTKYSEFVFEYVANEPISARQQENVQSALNEYLEPGLTAIFQRTDKIKRSQAGKLKHFHCLLES